MMTHFTKKMLLILISCQLLLTISFAQDDLTYKVMMGYQGWFLAKGDNAAPDKWVHWFNSASEPTAEKIGIDYWPAMDEYKNTYETDMNYMDGSNAKLFSPYDSSTVNVHFKWMRDYGIYGVYLQRFLGPVASRGDLFESRNKVLENVIGSAEIFDRNFAVMYDISGVADDGQLYNKLIDDWEYLVDTYDVLNKPGYVYQDGRPVIAIWGIGFSGRGLTTATFEAIIDYFHNTADPKYQAYIMGGLPSRWRTLEGDSESDPAWLDIYYSLDMISPWTVGRYRDQETVDGWKTDKLIPDLNGCFNNGVDYMPVIWPGFSWKNIHDGPLNQIPRDGGNYYWRQAYNAISIGSQFLYVAMFDEVDEGTVMFKLAETKSQVPVGIQDRIVTLDADGYDLPSDWYLRLGGESQKMLDGSIPLTSTIPITPYEGNYKEYISYCDSKTGWISENTLAVNSTMQKRGTGALQSTGSESDEFSRNFLTPFAIGTSTSIGFWYYVSDVSKLDAENEVELGSGGAADLNEYNWTLEADSLNNGWNYIKLDFTDATITGGDPNTDELNWFRIFHAKNGSVATMIDDIKFRGADGIQKPVADAGPSFVKIDNDEDGIELVQLDASRSIDFDGTISSYSWVNEGVEVSTVVNPTVSLEVGTHLYLLTVTDNDGNKDEDQITVTVQLVIDDCDSKTGWNSANPLEVNTTDQKKGLGALQSDGSNADEFSKLFPWVMSADSSTGIGFWYYVSDTSKFDSDNQVEFGSGGEPDLNEYSWSLDSLHDGWNYVNLNFSDALVTGGDPDQEKFNWFRLYRTKNGTVTTMIDDIKFRGLGGNQVPEAQAGPDQTVKSDSALYGSVTLDGSGSFDLDGEIVSYSWTQADTVIATGVDPTTYIAEGKHTVTLTVTDNDGATNDDQVIITVYGEYFDDCDSKADWNGSNTITLNTENRKQGIGCVEAAGSGTDDFKKAYSEAVSAEAYRSLQFWYYVSDPSLFDSGHQVELGSAGRPDQNEWNWKIENADSGWNYVTLNFDEAGETEGAPDLSAINWFRLYHKKTGSMISRIDAIKFGGVNELPIADAGPDQTLFDDDGDGKESVTLDGRLSEDPDGIIDLYSWTKSGSEIATGSNPTIDLSVGIHKITLTVMDDIGAKDDSLVTITVEDPTGVDADNDIPKEYALDQNYPNPFNPSSMIRYSIPKSGHVKLQVYDVLGKEVATLVNEVKAVGHYNVVFNADHLASGVYYYRIKSNNFENTKKLILLR